MSKLLCGAVVWLIVGGMPVRADDAEDKAFTDRCAKN